MRVNAIFAAILSSVVVTAILAGFSQYENGAPKLVRSVATGVSIGIINTVLLHFMMKKKEGNAGGS
ncbi:hypothetical protein Poly51_62830 [Rubripirellula tenax]|uniref:Uncharacterized protein n=1 Tax=Rubripirellula tenax TaxID=2528015 RepID=A0A5C6E409_9BACT|nr:hypothetical protein Poly51_62830 [Rubripirellula tenax]